MRAVVHSIMDINEEKVAVVGYDGIWRVALSQTYFVHLASMANERKFRNWKSTLRCFEENGGSNVTLNSPSGSTRSSSVGLGGKNSRRSFTGAGAPRLRKKPARVPIITPIPMVSVANAPAVDNEEVDDFDFGKALGLDIPLTGLHAVMDAAIPAADLTYFDDAQLNAEVQRRNVARMSTASKNLSVTAIRREGPNSKQVRGYYWTREEDEVLALGVASCLNLSILPGITTWKYVANLVKTRGHRQCKRRWESIDPNRCLRIEKERKELAARRAKMRIEKLYGFDVAQRYDPILCDSNVNTALQELSKLNANIKPPISLYAHEVLDVSDEVHDVPWETMATGGVFKFGTAKRASYSFGFKKRHNAKKCAKSRGKITDYLKKVRASASLVKIVNS